MEISIMPVWPLPGPESDIFLLSSLSQRKVHVLFSPRAWTALLPTATTSRSLSPPSFSSTSNCHPDPASAMALGPVWSRHGPIPPPSQCPYPPPRQCPPPLLCSHMEDFSAFKAACACAFCLPQHHHLPQGRSTQPGPVGPHDPALPFPGLFTPLGSPL